MICNKKNGKLGSGVPWFRCLGEMDSERFYDNDKTKSVLFSKHTCKKCGNIEQGIIWQR